MKVQIYSRDKTVEMQQKQIKSLMEEIREAKQFEYLCKNLQIMNNSLEAENKRMVE